MRKSLKLGKIAGIPLQLHYTWFIIFILITASLIAYLPTPGYYILWQRIILGIIASLLFFVSITAHELAHSIIAVRNNIPVKNITLFVFGGVSQLTKEANRPTTEILLAIVGPLSSIIIAGIFHGIHLLLGNNEPLSTVAQWLAFINALMAMFNLIPGFPLDGGRVFRAIIWLRTGNYMQATHIATLTGRIIGYIFIAGGIIFMFITSQIFTSYQWITGLWLAFIGWFLEIAASISYRQASLHNVFNNYTIRDLMITDYPIISQELNLERLVHDHFLPTGHQLFIVTKEGKLEGIIALSDIKKVSQKYWHTTPVKKAMIPADRLEIVHPEQDILSLLEQMDGKNIKEVPVIEGEKIIGMISRDNIMRRFQIHTQLKI